MVSLGECLLLRLWHGPCSLADGDSSRRLGQTQRSVEAFRVAALWLVGRMKVNILVSQRLRFPAALAVLLLAAGMAITVSEAETPSQDSASKVVRTRQDEAPIGVSRHSRGVQNRISPKRRAGTEGSAEAKIDAEQARELYIRRKLRLEQIHHPLPERGHEMSIIGRSSRIPMLGGC